MSETSNDAPTTIGVIFGGMGPEHSVSCLSASSIVREIDSQGFKLLCIGISKSGHWHLVPQDTVVSYSIASGSLPEVSTAGDSVSIHIDPKTPGFEIAGNFTPCAVVFPIVHGFGGEDGQLQGLLDTAGISYVGSGVEASAICMNKVTAKTLVQSSGIETGDWLSFNTREKSGNLNQSVENAWNLWGNSTVFVKPVGGGSSIGISLVKHQSEINGAFAAAVDVSDQVIVEKGLSHPREIEVAILETSGGIMASPVGEIKIHPSFEFYDFEAKYIAHGADLVTPATLDAEIADHICTEAINIFRILGCRDYARVDFFIDENSRLIFNEINTAPGFTSISMFARMWAAGGVEFPDLIRQLVGNAFARSMRIPDTDS